jgi:hypothetical protein
VIALLLLSTLLAADLPPAEAQRADSHLVTGAQLFRDQKFDQALVEFQVAQKLGALDAGWYAASALVKLDRPEQALVAFAEASEQAPDASDALLDYYRGVACYQERLYVCADGLLASVQARAGPKIAQLVRALRAKMVPVLSLPPPPGAIDVYLARAKRFRSDHKPALARLFAQEAAALANRREDKYRLEDATSELSLATAVSVLSPRP